MKYVYKHLTEKAIWFFNEYISNSVGYIEFIEKKKSKFPNLYKIYLCIYEILLYYIKTCHLYFILYIFYLYYIIYHAIKLYKCISFNLHDYKYIYFYLVLC